MADLSNAKLRRALWPPDSLESTWGRLQPLLTVPQLKAYHLFGVSLASQMPDPVTKQHQVMTDPMLEGTIERAVEIAEAETMITIMPTEIGDNLPFDRPAFESLGYFRTKRRPLWGVRDLTIRTTDDVDVYRVPLEWISMAMAHRGQINIIPHLLGTAITAMSPTPASGAAAASWLNAMASGTFYVPAYWYLTAEYGFPDGLVPAIVNELIGAIAAMEVLSQLAATYAHIQSSSIGADGISQSVSTPGGQIFAVRMDELAKKREKLTQRIKSAFGTKWALSIV